MTAGGKPAIAARETMHGLTPEREAVLLGQWQAEPNLPPATR